MNGPVILRRIDPEQNMARFYRMQLQPTLFGGITLVREWGRIGQAGTCRYDHYRTADAARSALYAVHESKLGRGYK
ncbi:WGR domain-containing protein [Roseibaca sp. Y0-43]|uniref:WGR domain-containing protein n=1 Tax=Roseibaca sp. Y0-43 TaxID=2816854 RepID=UPI001D0BFC57|nr:WGR domain-containing protein [Roseibaca sp. Y0-43]MCC1482923.1 WGR domain-containing protein [Roseibaca sp. Y0-43]